MPIDRDQPPTNKLLLECGPEGTGYSATVEGYFIVGDRRYRLAKTNPFQFTLAEPCEFPQGTVGVVLVIIDGLRSSRCVEVEGVVHGQTAVRYKEVWPETIAD